MLPARVHRLPSCVVVLGFVATPSVWASPSGLPQVPPAEASSLKTPPPAVFSAQLIAEVVESAARQEHLHDRIVQLAVPETRGEIVRVTVAIGELTARLADRISDARRRRAERKARELVERDLQNFLAQHAAK